MILDLIWLSLEVVSGSEAQAALVQMRVVM
jgi:hypothetical protein